ncbi:MAG: hypothetical protein CM1200mP13_05640 [Candidatus Pelagibacterales bacterium]|nr:MAG: hypothetical protein CM1200mP13_05640 [Pelagibacterales bacterium]
MAKKDYLNIISGAKKNALNIFFKYKGFIKKKRSQPITRVKNPEPKMDDPDWIIWAPGQIGSLSRKLKKKQEKKNLM